MTSLSKKIILEIFIAISISLLVILYSDSVIFSYIFKLYNITHLEPSFADIRSYQALPLTVDSGFDPYVNHVYDPWKRPFNLPIIWYYISKYLNLVNEFNFKLFVFLYISSFIFCVIRIISISKNIISSFIIILIFLSSSTILAIERGNTDMLIFSIIFVACTVNNFYISFVLIFFASILKLYPIFTFNINFDLKKKIIFSITGIFLIFVILFKNLNNFFYNTHSSFDTGITYGFRSIIMGLYKLEERLGLDLLSKNEILYNVLYLFFLIFISLFVFYFVRKKNYNNNIDFIDTKNRLFIAGASIYCFSYIFFSSYDYRLIFLILIVPYLVSNFNLLNKISIFFILITSNSILIYSVADTPYEYMYIGIFTHLCKFFLFLLILRELTKFLKVLIYNVLLIKN